MQRLVDMSTSELIHTATQYSASIKEVGIYSELMKELITRLGANTAAVTQALKERDEAREQVVNIALENAGLKSVTTLFGKAFDDLFSQCCSNPVSNARGKPVNLTLVNKAREQSSVKTPATYAAIAGCEDKFAAELLKEAANVQADL